MKSHFTKADPVPNHVFTESSLVVNKYAIIVLTSGECDPHKGRFSGTVVWEGESNRNYRVGQVLSDLRVQDFTPVPIGSEIKLTQEK